MRRIETEVAMLVIVLRKMTVVWVAEGASVGITEKKKSKDEISEKRFDVSWRDFTFLTIWSTIASFIALIVGLYADRRAG